MNRPSILYVEDEEDYQLVVRRILTPAGFDVLTADTGDEGFAALRRRRPRLLMLDINLPDMDGYSLCELLRQDPAWEDLPILMLTVRRRPEEWLRGFSSGANDYLQKPFNPPELLERVRHALEGKTQALQKSGTPEYLLIRAAVTGNRAAFEVLIEKYRARLVEGIHHLVRHRSEAEDIVSQAFLRAYENLEQFRGEASFYTWLYRIAINESIAFSEKPANISFEQLTRDGEYAPPALRTHPEPLVMDIPHEEERERARQAVHRLPDPYGRMMRMYFLKEMSYQDIAQKMRIPVGTVMSRLFRARELMRAAYRSTGGKPS